MSAPMPAIFFGHGSPMNALESNAYSRGWAAIGAALPRPTAVLAISAHWYVPGTPVTAMDGPRTIHDFGGFPPELYRVQYPAPGSATLAERVAELLAPVPVPLDHRWGLDHGTWSVLRHLFPAADVPVVQLGIDATQGPRFHYRLGQGLAPLRDEGVLVIGSGNVVHNLHAYDWERRTTAPFDWAVRFEERVRAWLVAGAHDALVDFASLGEDARRAVPTPDHYLPLLYVAGLQRAQEAVDFPIEGFDGGAISMLAVRIQ
jgi:4,5-DOPA dioxygenase extradiol